MKKPARRGMIHREVDTAHPTKQANHFHQHVSTIGLDVQIAKRMRAIEKQVNGDEGESVTIVVVPGSRHMIQMIHDAFEGTTSPVFIECSSEQAWKYVESGEADVLCIDLSDRKTLNSGIVERMQESDEAQPVTVVLFGSPDEQLKFSWFKRSILCGWNCPPSLLLSEIASHTPILS